MQVHTAHPNPLIQYGIMLLVFAVVIGLRARRMRQMRPLRLEWLWVVPALYLVVVAGLFLRGLPSAIGWLGCIAALAVGAVLGWHRGKAMEIHVNPETHALNQRGSLVALLFLVGLIAVKMIAQTEGSALHMNVVLLTQMLGALALGMFVTMRIEMYLRARRLLEAARTARPA
jgi:membrane protein CcdC involved in cytochrome C biogenesis